MVIVNFNTGHRLKTCLSSVFNLEVDGFELSDIVVVDNASTDASSHAVSADRRVRLVLNSVNRGFAVACNQGAALTGSDYLLFLNPDTDPAPSALATAISFLESPESGGIGICGVRLLDENARLDFAAARFPSVRTYVGEITRASRLLPSVFPPHELPAHELTCSRAVEQVSGAFFLVRRALFESLRGFDERFFVYYEEVDFSLRARQAGYLSYYLTDALCIHVGGGSSGSVPVERLFYNIRSRLQFAHKHFSPGDFATVLTLTWLVELPLRLGHATLSPEYRSRHVLEAYRRLWRWTPRLFGWYWHPSGESTVLLRD